MEQHAQKTLNVKKSRRQLKLLVKPGQTRLSGVSSWPSVLSINTPKVRERPGNNLECLSALPDGVIPASTDLGALSLNLIGRRNVSGSIN